jgi:hypothetical protein
MIAAFVADRGGRRGHYDQIEIGNLTSDARASKYF